MRIVSGHRSSRRFHPLPQFALALLLIACAVFPSLAQHATGKSHHAGIRHKSANKARKAPAKPAAKASVKVWGTRRPASTTIQEYHYPGARWYGATEQGEYMGEDAARKAGYRSAENGQ